jgi:hypothetical protein
MGGSQLSFEHLLSMNANSAVSNLLRAWHIRRMGLLLLVIDFRNDVKKHTLLAEPSRMITSQFRESQDLIHCPMLRAKWIWPWHLTTVHRQCHYLGEGNELNVFLFLPEHWGDGFRLCSEKFWQLLCKEVPVTYLNWLTTNNWCSQFLSWGIWKNGFGNNWLRMKTVLFHVWYKVGCEFIWLHSSYFSSWQFLGADDLTQEREMAKERNICHRNQIRLVLFYGKKKST